MPLVAQHVFVSFSFFPGNKAVYFCSQNFKVCVYTKTDFKNKIPPRNNIVVNCETINPGLHCKKMFFEVVNKTNKLIISW